MTRCVLVIPDPCIAAAVPVSRLAAAWTVTMVSAVSELTPGETAPVIMFGPQPAAVAQAARTVAAPVIVVRDANAKDGEIAFLRAGAAEVLDCTQADMDAPEIERAVARAQARYQAATEPRHMSRNDTAALTVVDRLPIALLLVRADSTLIHGNGRARKILQAGTALALDSTRRLRASHPADTHKLHDTIAAVAQGGTDLDGALAIQQSDGSPPLSVIIVPAGSAGHGAALFVSSHDTDIEIREDSLMALYGLSLAEARLVIQLVQGKTLEAISEERGHSRHTLRAQLKAIFRKTGVNRQSDLMKLILTGPAIIRRS